MATVTCADCAWTGDERYAEGMPETDIFERVHGGEIMPAGQCPACGAVCHYDTNPRGVAQLSRSEWALIIRGLQREALNGPMSDMGGHKARCEALALRLSAFAEEEGEGQDDCDNGLHSWTNAAGPLPPDTACTACGELYGNPD